jgi:hypothetical protein
VKLRIKAKNTNNSCSSENHQIEGISWSLGERNRQEKSHQVLMCESLKLNRKETPSNQVNENSSKNTPKMTKKRICKGNKSETKKQRQIFYTSDKRFFTNDVSLFPSSNPLESGGNRSG